MDAKKPSILRRAFGKSPDVLCVILLAWVTIGLMMRSDFFLGSAFALSRWPMFVFCMTLGVLLLRRKRRFSPLVCLIAVLLILGEWAYTQATVRRLPSQRYLKGEQQRFSVLTYNLLFRGGTPRISLETIRDNPVDLVAVQEMTPAWRKRLDRILGQTHKYNALSSHRGTRGFGMYSRFPLADVRYLRHRSKFPFAQCARVKHPGTPLYVCNVHLAAPSIEVKTAERLIESMRSNAITKERQWEKLTKQILTSADRIERRLVVGDLNTMPAEPLYRRMMRDFVDAYSEVNLGYGATFPNLLSTPPFPVLRIDYILLDGPMAPESVRVLPKSGSDHLAVHAVVKL